MGGEREYERRRVLHSRDGLADDHVGLDFLERLQGVYAELY